MVLGAGRGPLVRAALNASENTGRKVRVYIIEKNPNAIRTLTAVAKKLWSNKGKQLEFRIHFIMNNNNNKLFNCLHPLFQMFIFSPKICVNFRHQNKQIF